MEPTMSKQIEETVTDILETSDMQEMTEYKVRKLAAEKLKIDLSEPCRKKLVRTVVEAFLQKQAQAQQQQDAAVEPSGGVEEEEEEEQVEEGNDRGGDGDGDGDGKEYDDDGDLIVCRLSDKRRVTIQDFRGKTLVSIREFYKKDGKYLPTSKGISLTTEQWSSFKKNVPAIEEAIKKTEDRLY